MPPNSIVAMRDKGQGRNTEAKTLVQGTVGEGMPPRKQNEGLTMKILHCVSYIQNTSLWDRPPL